MNKREKIKKSEGFNMFFRLTITVVIVPVSGKSEKS
jgi:hypothetical protein